MSHSPNSGGAPATAAPRHGVGLRGFRFTAIAAVLGAAVAGAYAHFIGCKTGSCPITSSVWTASTYGGLFGLLLGWPTKRGSRQSE